MMYRLSNYLEAFINVFTFLTAWFYVSFVFKCYLHWNRISCFEWHWLSI